MTELQQALLDFLTAHKEARGVAPSLDDIGLAFPRRPNPLLRRSLDALAVSGLVQELGGRWQVVGTSAQLHFDLSALGAPPR